MRQTSQARAGPERPGSSNAPPQGRSAAQTRGSLLGFQHALGNRAVLHMLGTHRLQPKLRVGPAGDVFEQEADRVAQSVVSMSRTGMAEGAGSLRSAPAGGVQRKCAKCEEEEEETLRRSPADGAETAAESVGEQEAAPPTAETTPESPATEQVPEEQASAEASSEQTAGAALLVEDEAEEVGPGQMRKSEFVAALRESVCATANEAMASTGQTTENCPWMGYWFDQAEQKDAAYVEKFLRKYAPETAGAATAQEFIPLVAARVRRSVDVWVKTGEITGVPEGVSTEAPGAGSAEAGQQASQGGSVLFKARPGGARAVSDPAAIRNQLGTGHPLPGGVRSRMESAFGLSFSQVRLHTDSGAAALSDQLNARAFTVGEHVAFGPSEYRPGTLVGDALLAHELAHVVQQGGATADSGPMMKGEGQYNSLEQDADRSAVGAVASLWTGAGGRLKNLSRNLVPSLKSGLRLSRCPTKAAPTVEKLNVCIRPVQIAEDDGTKATTLPSFAETQAIWAKCCIDVSVGGSTKVSKTDYKTLDDPGVGSTPSAEETSLFAAAGGGGGCISVFVPENFNDGTTIGKDVSGGGVGYDGGTADPKVVVVEGIEPTIVAHEMGHAMGYLRHDPAGTVMEVTANTHTQRESDKVATVICKQVRKFVGATGTGKKDCTTST